jgi:hypothetical protein
LVVVGPAGAHAPCSQASPLPQAPQTTLCPQLFFFVPHLSEPHVFTLLSGVHAAGGQPPSGAGMRSPVSPQWSFSADTSIVIFL